MTLPPLFNPSNDMALAANLRQYTPPRPIRQMEDDLRDLARLWDEGPWGWSLCTKQRYLRMGVPESHLPTDEWLVQHRRLSSREFGVEYYRRLSFDLTPAAGSAALLPCQARFVEGLEALEALRSLRSLRSLGSLRTLGTFLIFKAPWSSSGRGNILVQGEMDDATRRRIEKIIQEQGGIVVEPFYADKALDFAMEFWVDDRETRFLGYSVFSADEMGHYGGNYVESQPSLLRRIGLPGPLLDSLIQYHCRRLSSLPYRGPVGIDMMRFHDGRVHPCVEINFRMTMGLLALLLYNKGITDDQLLTPRRDHGFTAEILRGRLTLTRRP